MNFIEMIKPALVLILCALIAPSVTADVRFVEGDKTKPNMAQWPHLAITGKISSTDADVEKLTPMIHSATLSSRVLVGGSLAPLVMLNSSGGDVIAAMYIGLALRAFNAFTIVGVNAECSSACVLILAAGARRDVFNNARVGLHRPYFEESLFAGLTTTQAQDKYAAMERRVSGYLKNMGMPDSLFEKMRSIPSRRMDYVKRNDLKALSLVGFDPAMEELERAKEKEHFAKDPAMYEYLQQIRNCLDLGRPYNVCEDSARRAFKRSKN